MFKLFEWIGSLLAILILLELLLSPKQALQDIKNGPMPALGRYNSSLNKRSP